MGMRKDVDHCLVRYVEECASIRLVHDSQVGVNMPISGRCIPFCMYQHTDLGCHHRERSVDLWEAQAQRK
jgi:hypothetical protein